MIAVRHLRLEYDKTVALENLSLDIAEGEVFGLIGPNGAGKTTLIRILSTLLEPTYGQVEIAGIDVVNQPLEVHPLIGYMSDFFSLYENMTAWEYLDHFARCYRIGPGRREKLIDEALELVSLEVRRNAEINELSRGMRQRLCFAKSLLHEPKVLLLDEPASGLDPAGRVEFRELIKQLQLMGRTIIISSHILTEMTEFCTSIGILEKGQLVVSGRVDDILARLQSALQVEIEVSDHQDRLERLLTAEPQVCDLVMNSRSLKFCWKDRREDLPQLHRRIVEHEIPVISFSVVEDNLEEIYMKLSTHKTS